MRIPAMILTLAVLLAPLRAVGQEALDPVPMTWHGVQLGGEQVFEGDLTVNFETSTFRPDGAPAGDIVWLSGWEDRPGDNGGIIRRYHLRFIGRQTVEPGKFGSLGAYKQTILITRVISTRLLIGQH
jgi:hypothetical protein